MKTLFISFFLCIMSQFVVAQVILQNPQQIPGLNPLQTTDNCGCPSNEATRWSSIKVKQNSFALRDVRCGHQFGIKVGEVMNLKGGFACINNCIAHYKIRLTTATDSLIANSAGNTFDWTYKFKKAGSYVLEVTPICGRSARCVACRFYFTVYG